MTEIRIEGKPVTGINGDGTFGHLYLVFVDDDGSERVLRGGPKGLIPPPLGNIDIEIDISLGLSKDVRPQTERSSHGSQVIDLGGRDAHVVWQQMVQHSRQIQDAQFWYDPLVQNSNSVVVSLLYNAGISIDSYLENLPQWSYPGFVNYLNTDYLNTPLGISAEGIKAYGYDGNDGFIGGHGNDILVGGRGDDVFFGGSGNDYSLVTDS